MLGRELTSRDPDAAFLALVTAHEDTLVRAARLLTGDWAQAEELLRDTLAWTLTAWPTLGADPGAPLRVRQRLVTAYLETAPDAAADAAADPDADPDAERDGGTSAERDGGVGAERDGGAGAERHGGAGAERHGGTSADWGGAGAGGAAEAGGYQAAGSAGDPAGADPAQRTERSEGAGGERVNGSAAGRPRPPLVESLRTLPAEERALVVARYYLGLSTAEIGEVLGVEAEEVAATAARLLVVLRWGR